MRSISTMRHGRPNTWTGSTARVRSDGGRLDQIGIEPEAVLLDVHEPGDGTLVEQAVGRCDEAERGGDDLVALADSERSHAHVEAGRSARAGDPVSPTGERRDRGLEPRRERAKREHVALEDLRHEFDLAWPDVGPREGDRPARGRVRRGRHRISGTGRQLPREMPHAGRSHPITRAAGIGPSALDDSLPVGNASVCAEDALASGRLHSCRTPIPGFVQRGSCGLPSRWPGRRAAAGQPLRPPRHHVFVRTRRGRRAHGGSPSARGATTSSWSSAGGPSPRHAPRLEEGESIGPCYARRELGELVMEVELTDDADGAAQVAPG